MLCKRLVHIAFALFAIGCGAVARSERPYDPSFAVEKYGDHYIVNNDGTYDEYVEWTLRVSTPEGVSSEGTHSLYYTGSQQTLEVLEAATIEPDGTRVPVGPGSKREQDDGAGGNGFNDTRSITLVFPKVEVGSRLYYRAHWHTHTPAYPEQFLATYVLSPHIERDEWEADFDMPAAMSLHVEQTGLTGGLENTVDGVSHYRFHYSDHTPIPTEPGSVSTADYADRLLVSTFADMSEVGAVYQARAKPMAKVTDAIRALALKLTDGLPDDRARVKALYTWVAENIRYVSVELGNDGRWIPHAADEVLNNRYGDCKDHVVLLEALLAAINIEVTVRRRPSI